MKSFRSLALIAAGLSILPASLLAQVEPIARRPEDYPPKPKACRDPDEYDAPRRARVRRRKMERAAARALKAGGISGAGLWRKCRASGRVRGW